MPDFIFKQSTEQFDIIFLDPPFAQNYIPQCLFILVQNKYFSSGGLVYIEISPPPLILDEQSMATN